MRRSVSRGQESYRQPGVLQMVVGEHQRGTGSDVSATSAPETSTLIACVVAHVSSLIIPSLLRNAQKGRDAPLVLAGLHGGQSRPDILSHSSVRAIPEGIY